MLSTELVEDLAEVGATRSSWDALAVETAQPYCAPAWMLAWWRHVSPPGAQLRIVLVRDRGELVGVAPFFCERNRAGLVRYRILGAHTSSGVDLLARRGQEGEVAASIAEILIRARPSPDVVLFEGSRGSVAWPGLVATSWSELCRVGLHRRIALDAPTLSLVDRSYDEWFASKSTNFRQSMRRRMRQLERAGVRARLSTPGQDLSHDLRRFAALHHRRWRARGGSGVLDPRVEAMLAEAAGELISSGRFRLWSLEADGQMISAHAFVCAGGEVAYWLGGFEPDWARLQPATVTLLLAIEHAFATGDRRVDLGSGSQPYKLRFSDGADRLEWSLLVPFGLRAPLAWTQLLPLQARLAVASSLSPRAKRWARNVVASLPRRLTV